MEVVVCDEFPCCSSPCSRDVFPIDAPVTVPGTTGVKTATCMVLMVAMDSAAILLPLHNPMHWVRVSTCWDGMRRCHSHRKSSFDAFCVGSKFLLLPVLERRRILHEVFFHPPFSPVGVLQFVWLLLRGDAYESLVRGTTRDSLHHLTHGRFSS